MRIREDLVTVDGPVASGKSTGAKLVGSALGYTVLEAGMLYRAITLFIHDAGLPQVDCPELAQALGAMTLEVGGSGRVLVGGIDVTHRLRTPLVSSLTPNLSELMAVRSKAEPIRQKMIQAGRLVLVRASDSCPEARFKFWLDADIETRARRWQLEMLQAGVEMHFNTARSQVQERDRADSHRVRMPLLIPEGAVRIDTARLTPEQVSARILGVIQGLR